MKCSVAMFHLEQLVKHERMSSKLTDCICPQNVLEIKMHAVTAFFWLELFISHTENR